MALHDFARSRSAGAAAVKLRPASDASSDAPAFACRPPRVSSSAPSSRPARLVLAFWGPRHVPNPALFATLLAASALASSLRLRVPLGTSSSNLSISYSVDFAALLLIGPELTMLVAGVSAWLQSAFGHDQAQSRLPCRLQHRRARAHSESRGIGV